MMKKWFFIGGLWIICGVCFGQDKKAYIEMYKNIAVTEMMRTGIPASIKLAQAILESDCGKSDLACKANNHFGIKCGNDWKGKSYKKEDDDFEDGKLVKSCFREFRTVYDSYLAHSDFLTDPAKSKRYGSLFDLKTTDYKGWAKGLSKAGYATDPQYSSRLIDIIERYELNQLDTHAGEELATGSPRKKSTDPNLSRYNNDVKYDLAEAGDTPFSFAQRHDVTVRQLIRYNDDIDDEDQELREGTFVYLQPKRNQFNGRQKVYLLKPGDDLITISQQYGIKLEALLKRNGLREGDIPAPNQKIALKGKSQKELRTIDPYELPTEQPSEKTEPVVTQNIILASTTNSIEFEPKKEMRTETSPGPAIQITIAKPEHTVSKGETLYGIAATYGITVAELKKMNNLSADTISIGQKLSLK